MLECAKGSVEMGANRKSLFPLLVGVRLTELSTGRRPGILISPDDDAPVFSAIGGKMLPVSRPSTGYVGLPSHRLSSCFSSIFASVSSVIPTPRANYVREGGRAY